MAKRVFSDEARRRMSEAKRGHHVSEETRQRMSEAKRGKPVSDETRRRMADAKRGKPGNHRIPHSESARLKMSQSHTGLRLTDAHRHAISNTLKNRAQQSKTFTGGQTGDDFAAVLCPAGFVREWIVVWGDDGGKDRFVMDFAHVDGKINIELDGPGHRRKSTLELDSLRDQVLQLMGWRVIRIKHG